MKLLDRLLVSDFAYNFLASLTGLLFLFFVAEFLKIQSDTTSQHAFFLSLFQMPWSFLQFAPAACMLSAAVTLSTLSRRNEITAMRAAGISDVHIAGVILGCVLLICSVSFFVNHKILPEAAKAKLLYTWREVKGRKDFSLDVQSRKIWYKNKNYLFNVRLFERSSKSVRGFSVYLIDEGFRLQQYVHAQEASYSEDQWNLKKGILAVFSEDGGFPQVSSFDEKKFTLDVSPQDFLELDQQVESMKLNELYKYIQRSRLSGIPTHQYETDFHSRVSFSLLPIILVLMVIPFSMRHSRFGGMGKDLTFCILLALGYWILFSIAASFGRSGAVDPALAIWSPFLIFTFLATVLLLKRQRLS